MVNGTQGKVRQGQSRLRRMDVEGQYLNKGMEAPRQYSQRAQLLGSPRSWPRERSKFLLGENGVHSWRTQEHLQGEGKAGGESLSLPRFIPPRSLCKASMMHFVMPKSFFSLCVLQYHDACFPSPSKLRSFNI